MGAVVVTTLREQEPRAVASLDAAPSPTTTTTPTPVAAKPTLGVVAASGNVVLRWVGAACQGGQPAAVQRSADGGTTWDEVGTPFATVEQIVLAGDAGLVRGFDTSCNPVAATTRDAGATWQPLELPDGTTSVDVLADGGRWTVVNGVIERGEAAVSDPCRLNAAGAVSLVSATTADAAWVLCQDDDGSGRLLVRTTDGGRTWRRLAGRRTETGLAGPGTIAAMDHLPGNAGWALIRGSACAEGELRITSVAGAGWTPLPCVSRSVTGVTQVLSVTFADARDAVLVALVDDEVRLLRSGDGGRSWTVQAG